ncbi:MAG: polyketide synthase, partial [Pirellulales bacterium]|nr:polyketide synthase [Pirellulales bacterium]
MAAQAPPQPPQLDPQLNQLLGSLRQRVRRYVVIDSLLALAAVVLSAFWLGLALDYLPVQLGGTEMPRLARTLLLAVLAAVVAVLVFTMLWGRLHRPLPDDSLALLVERQHPQLGGRLVTAVQLNQPGRSGDSHSPQLLRQVHDQAASAIDDVDPNRVFRWQPLVRKSVVVGPLALLVLVFVLVSPQAFALAVSRLTLLTDEPWPRRADLEMVGVELPLVLAAEDESAAPQLVTFQDKVIRLPRGSSGTLRIRARAQDAELPVVCTVQYRTADGTRGQSNMRRVGRVVDGYQSFVLDGPPLADLGGSLTFSVRGLDDRLDDFRIEAVQPPAFTQLQVLVRYPDYLREVTGTPHDLETDYQAGLRIREGSQVTLLASSNKPLGEVDVLLKTDVGDQQPAAISYSDDRRQMRLKIDRFDSATTIHLVPQDKDGISAQAPYRYFVGVVLDEPPDLEVELQGIGNAVTPIARIPVAARAVDDYGVEKLEIAVTPSSETEQQPLAASVSPQLDRDGHASANLDLRDLV